MKSYKAFTPEQRRAWWFALMGIFSWLIAISLRVWSRITHHPVHFWISFGLQMLGILGMGFSAWTSYHDPSKPYK
jgi:drug/metabolite transporter (DMT)-like permease